MRHSALTAATRTAHPACYAGASGAKFPDAAIDCAAGEAGRRRCRRAAVAVRQGLVGDEQPPAAFVEESLCSANRSAMD